MALIKEEEPLQGRGEGILNSIKEPSMSPLLFDYGVGAEKKETALYSEFLRRDDNCAGGPLPFG